jgi:AraC-like DNA-binding protein
MPAAREVITPDPRRSFRTTVHDYPTPVAGWHYHPELEIHLIRASTGAVIAGDYIGNFGPGQVTLMGPGLPHDWMSDLAPGEVVHSRDSVIQFNAEWLQTCQQVIPELKELDALLGSAARGLLFSGETASRAADEIIAVVTSAGPERVASLFRLLTLLNNAPASEAEALAGQWFVAPTDRGGNAAVEAGVAYIFDNLDRDVRLPVAAELAHMSESAFSRYFKKASGLTFSEMVRKLRIANACRLLDTTDRSIGSICAASGYSNVSNFNRQFLVETGSTPRQYRRLNASLKPGLTPPGEGTGSPHSAASPD